MTSVLISERLIFLKLVFKAFWSRFQSDKHLLNIEKRPYFSVLKSRLFSWCVLKGSCIAKLISLDLFKSCVKVFHSLFFQTVIYK